MTNVTPEASQDATVKPSRKRTSIKRPSSDATRWHMSKDAVDRSVTDISKWTDLQCVRHMAEVRWGSFKRVVCPHCATGAEHYWSTRQMRWKCKSCGSSFSVTSQTVFAGRKMSLQKLLVAVHLWAAGASGKPALEVRRILKFGGYNTGFVFFSKLREGLLRGFHTGLVSGVVEMDGAHASGRRASEKRGRPLNKQYADEVEAARDDALLTTSAKQAARRKQRKEEALASGGVLHPEHGKVFPASRRITFTVRRRSSVAGKGAMLTRVGIGLTETPDVVQSLVDAYVVVPESILATDTGSAFKKAGKKFQMHLEVNHSETLVGPEGQHNNNAESFSARQDRAEKGIYLNIEPKYLRDYATETAFREDNRRTATGAVGDRALHHALNVGLSKYWRGFTHGHHRNFEFLHPSNQAAKASGPEKGQSPVSMMNGRAPR